MTGEEDGAVPIRRGLKKLKEWFIHLFHLDDSAHRIALGVAIGTFVAFTPTWGVQMLLVVALAWLLRANKVAGIPMVWLTNPFTNVPIYSFCYWVGQAITDGPGLGDFRDRFGHILSGDSGWWDSLKQSLALAYDVAIPLWIGTIVVGLVSGLILYVALYYLISYYRRVHGHRPGGSASSGGASAA